jgi:hypothetical protein
MALEIKGRAQTAPPTDRLAGHRLLYRTIPQGLGPTTAWRTKELLAMTMPSGSTSYISKPRQVLAYGADLTGFTGGITVQFEFVRVSPTLSGAGATNLAGDFNLNEYIVEFLV